MIDDEGEDDMAAAETTERSVTAQECFDEAAKVLQGDEQFKTDVSAAWRLLGQAVDTAVTNKG